MPEKKTKKKPARKKIRQTKVKDLKAAPYNPRQISKKQLAMLKKSLEEFGDLSGIVFNIQTGNLIGGHQRVSLFDPSWPIDKTKGIIKTPFGDCSYREVDWPEEKEKAANIAANKHSGEWESGLLSDLLADLNDLPDFDMELTGFDEIELKDFGIGIGETELPDLKDQDREPFQQMSFILHDDQVQAIKKALRKAKDQGPFIDTGNDNQNGNAIARICEAYNGSSKKHNS